MLLVPQRTPLTVFLQLPLIPSLVQRLSSPLLCLLHWGSTFVNRRVTATAYMKSCTGCEGFPLPFLFLLKRTDLLC